MPTHCRKGYKNQISQQTVAGRMKIQPAAFSFLETASRNRVFCCFAFFLMPARSPNTPALARVRYLIEFHSEIRINRQRGGFITEFCYFLRKFADFAVEKAGAVGKAFLSADFVKKQRHSIMKPHGESAIMHLGMVRIL